MKRLIAIVVSDKNIAKTWSCKVSDDVTDVTVPNNTIMYFFTEESNENFELIQIKLNKVRDIISIDNKVLQSIVIDNKVFCCGRKVGKALVLDRINLPSVVVNDLFDTNKSLKFEIV